MDLVWLLSNNWLSVKSCNNLQMAQQWAALISLGSSGTQVGCPVLPPSPFTSRQPCPLLLSGEVHNRNSLSHKTRLAGSQGLVPLPWLGSKDGQVHLTFCNATRAETWQVTEELKYRSYSDSVLMWVFLFIHCSIPEPRLTKHAAIFKGHLWCWSSMESLWILHKHLNLHCTNTDSGDI